MYNTNDERAQSEFNMAVAYLYRLNSLLTLSNQSAINLDIYSWFHALLAITRELSPQMNPEELQNSDNYIAQLTPAITIFTANQQDEPQDIPPDIYHALHNYDKHLKSILSKSGLLNKTMDDAAHSLR